MVSYSSGNPPHLCKKHDDDDTDLQYLMLCFVMICAQWSRLVTSCGKTLPDAYAAQPVRIVGMKGLIPHYLTSSLLILELVQATSG